MLKNNSLLFKQGFYFLITGLWPVIHIKSFEQVTGPKNDHWLVKTVGLLVSITGMAFIISSKRKNEVPFEIKVISIMQAAALGGVSLFYSFKGRISKIYLLDALAEITFLKNNFKF